MRRYEIGGRGEEGRVFMGYDGGGEERVGKESLTRAVTIPCRVRGARCPPRLRHAISGRKLESNANRGGVGCGAELSGSSSMVGGR